MIHMQQVERIVVMKHVPHEHWVMAVLHSCNDA